MNVKLPKLKIKKPNLPELPMSLGKIFLISFIISYFIVGLLILAPVLDQQSWYPEFLPSYDVVLGDEFNDRKKAEIKEIDNETIDGVIYGLSKRLHKADIQSVSINKNNESLEVYFPKDTPDSFIRSLLSQGNIELMSFVEPETEPEEESKEEDLTEEELQKQQLQQQQEEAAAMLDPTNYKPTPIDLDKVTKAKIVSQQAQYAYIEVESPQNDEFENVSTTSGQLALFVDGSIVMCYVMPPTPPQSKNPTIIVMNQQNPELLAAKLESPTLPDLTTNLEIKESDPVINIQSQIILATILAIGLLGFISYKMITKQYTLNYVLYLAMIAVGSLAVVKLTGLTVTLITTLSLALFLLFIASEKLHVNLVYITLVGILVLVLKITNISILHSTSNALLYTYVFTIAFFLVTFIAGEYPYEESKI